MYDFRPLIKESYKVNIIKREGLYRRLRNDKEEKKFEIIRKSYEFNSSSNSKIEVLQTKLWPTASLLGLNDSQYKAIQLALTTEVVVLQGPPGTGKK